MKNFLTRIDLANDRQIKLSENQQSTFSGSVNTLQYTTLGQSYNNLKKGADESTSTVINQNAGVYEIFTFTGTTGSTTYFGISSIYSSIIPNLPIITSLNYANTFTSRYFDPIQTIIVDGNSFNISFSGSEFNFNVYNFGVIGSISAATFSGICSTNWIYTLSAKTYDWFYLKNGSTTWLNVTGRTHTQKLSIESIGVPTSSSSSGITGTITWDTNNIYVCVGPNSWKRATLSTF